MKEKVKLMSRWLKSGYIPVTIALVMLLLFVTPVMADEWVGGIPLETVQIGTVTGDLWFDVDPAPNWGLKDVTKTFTLPAAAVEEEDRITWARLYVSAYCGHMQDDKAFTITNSFDGDGDGKYEHVWPETKHSGFSYVQDPDTWGNDNTALGGGQSDPYKLYNDHENRVTSDYFMWYDVTDLITSQTVNVNVNTEGSFDGRIKVISLVVAYDDPSSTTETTYWVNQGHDVCSYYVEDNFCEAAVGTTTFDISGLPKIDSARLTASYMASHNGNYGFPTVENDFTYTGGTPPVLGTFTDALDRTPDVQGPYSGVISWDVTGKVAGKDGVTLAYARDFAGTGTAALFKIPLAFLVVKNDLPSPSGDVVISGSIVKPDLVVTSIKPNTGAGDNLFANEPNTISVTVQNQGEANAGASTLAIDVGGTEYTEAVGALAPGAEESVTITRETEYAHGTTLSVTATADSADVIDEGDETNNVLTVDLTVYDNGYKGKRWTPTLGDDMATQATFDGQYAVVYSHGDSAYQSAGWQEYTVTWSADDLPIPEGATVVDARLYQGWGWNKMATDPAPTMTFNAGEVGAPVATYKDQKNWGSYDYPYGLYVYNVTDQFNTAGNTLTITPETENNYFLYGAYLVVVYEDPATAAKQIFINDEFDMVRSSSAYSVSDGEATVYAPFSGVDTTDLTGARAIAVLASADEAGKSKFFFNNQEYPGFSGDYQTSSQVGFSIYDVTDALQSGANEARLQSFDDGTGKGGDSMYALTTILVVEKKVPAPAIEFTADVTSGTAPLTVTFTAANTGGTVDAWLWDFGDNTTSTDQNPTHVYASDGVYTVTLTATGPDHAVTATKENYISVGAATIAVSITPDTIAFGTMQAGVASTGSTAVAVTTTAGTDWAVTASATNDGYMTAGTSRLANAFQLANGDGEFHAMTTAFADFMTGTAGEGRTDTANVQQAIEKADAPGDYSITLTFTGAFV
jgi:PKD repeat protein